MSNCECDMSIVSVDERYFWEDDLLSTKMVETWECDKCGSMESVEATDEWLSDGVYQ